MAFAGYLLKVGTHDITPYISAKSYKSTPNRIQDLDSYRDANGLLKRNILPHTSSGIVFSTPPLYLADKITLQSWLPSRVKITATYWNDETNVYATGDFYIPDVEYSIYHVNTVNNNITYSPIAYEFIEY